MKDWGKIIAVIAATLAPQGVAGGVFGPDIYRGLKFAIETGGAARLQQLNNMINEFEALEPDGTTLRETDLRRWIGNLEAERDRILRRMREK